MSIIGPSVVDDGEYLYPCHYKRNRRRYSSSGNPKYNLGKLRDPTIAAKFNKYRFADYKEEVIELLRRVCTVNVRTMEVVDGMEDIGRVRSERPIVVD